MICFFCVFFVVGVGRDIECAGATESTDIFYVSVRVTCMIKLNTEENFQIWMFSFLGKSKYYLTQNDHLFGKEKIYFEAGRIFEKAWEEYFLNKLRLRRDNYQWQFK